ncbi:MAG: zinc-ribbon domain-containing protein [Geobacteraceae bacterium]|nr:zinc-ribbon domain-containing protein [Geobacteraceae bacterium]
MRIVCPECGYSAEIDAARIPAGGTSAGCPRCRTRFRVTAEEPAVSASEELQIICPSCAHEQALAPICERCGLIFARYRPPAEKQAARGGDPVEAAPSDTALAPERDLLSRLKRFNRDLRLPLAVLMLLAIWLLVKNLVPVSVLRTQETLSASAGVRHAVVARKDGTVWSWGSNSDGQLGYGERGGLVTAPARVPGIDGVTSVAAGALHTLALKSDGTVWSWGSNEHGQLGDATGVVERARPLPVPGLAGVSAIAAGDYFSVALKQDGTLWYFGDSFLGHLSNGGINPQIAVPVQVAGLSDVAAVACGRRSIIALKKDGTVRAWGENTQGELGDGSHEVRWEPVEVKGLQDVVAVAAGERFTLALKRDGTVWGWGTLHVADGDNLQRCSQPRQLLSGVEEIRAGYWHALALKGNGTVWYSGSSGKIQPDDETAGFPSMLKRSKTAGVSAIHAGGVESFLEKRNGTLLHLGYGEVGQEHKKTASTPPALTVLSFNAAEAGQAAAPLVAAAPAPATSPGPELQSITAGYEHSLALARDGTVWAWGNNENEQLGPRPDSFDASPGKMYLQGRNLFGAVRSVAGGEQFTVAVRDDGSIWMWGRLIPRYGGAAKQNCIRMPQLENVVSVSAGPAYFMALTKDGRVSIWGKTVGVDALREPQTVAGLADVTAISAGTNHRAVVKQDGTIWCLGKNDQGQLGDGSREIRTGPVLVRQCRDVIKVAAGSDFTLALKRDGTVWGWGANIYATTAGGLMVKDSAVPVRISGLHNITDIAVPGYSFSNGGHVLALDGSGTVWSRGFNNHGQLGQGTKSFSYVQTPARVAELKDIVAIAAGAAHSLALKKDGTLWAWGKNFRGQLGTGDGQDSAFPRRVQFSDGSTGKKPSLQKGE